MRISLEQEEPYSIFMDINMKDLFKILVYAKSVETNTKVIIHYLTEEEEKFLKNAPVDKDAEVRL